MVNVSENLSTVMTVDALPRAKAVTVAITSMHMRQNDEHAERSALPPCGKGPTKSKQGALSIALSHSGSMRGRRCGESTWKQLPRGRDRV